MLTILIGPDGFFSTMMSMPGMGSLRSRSPEPSFPLRTMPLTSPRLISMPSPAQPWTRRLSMRRLSVRAACKPSAPQSRRTPFLIVTLSASVATCMPCPPPSGSPVSTNPLRSIVTSDAVTEMPVPEASDRLRSTT